jgi:hypothetical protein
LENPVAAKLGETDRIAAVSVGGVAVVAKLVRVEDSVPATRRLFDATACATAVAVTCVAVVALLVAADDAVSAKDLAINGTVVVGAVDEPVEVVVVAVLAVDRTRLGWIDQDAPRTR